MKNVGVVVGFAIYLLFASTAVAGPIDYGDVDILQSGFNLKTDCTGLTSSECEEATLAAALGVSVEDVNLTKIDTSLSDWVYVEDYDASTNLAAFDFSKYGITDPLAYVVKIGNAEYDFYLYTNEENLQYALIDLNEVKAAHGNISITSLSHIATVPEPRSLSLLLSGLAVLGVFSVSRVRGTVS